MTREDNSWKLQQTQNVWLRICGLELSEWEVNFTWFGPWRGLHERLFILSFLGYQNQAFLIPSIFHEDLKERALDALPSEGFSLQFLQDITSCFLDVDQNVAKLILENTHHSILENVDLCVGDEHALLIAMEDVKSEQWNFMIQSQNLINHVAKCSQNHESGSLRDNADPREKLKKMVSTVQFTVSPVIFAVSSLNRYRYKYRADRLSAYAAEEAKIGRISEPYLRVTQQDLLIATSNFSDKKIIGKGRFGTVYRGILDNGQTVAIKRIKLEDPFSHSHFLSELRILGQLRHRNLLKILGYFFNDKEMLIISKFMANLSLDVLLHGPPDCKLNWKQRLNIAIGVAHGLAHLHHECRNTIVHCDLKPGNILVDENMEALIADFGLSKIINIDHMTESSLGPRFTVGYAAPERAYLVRPSPRTDVYSFGIVLLELISGLNPTSSILIDKGMTLSHWASEEYAEN
ncbi:hypothetical protein KI387_008965, partial [Taxus chinensis]